MFPQKKNSNSNSKWSWRSRRRFVGLSFINLFIFAINQIKEGNND